MPNVFVPADILLPDEKIPLEKWAALACDQFTSEPAYWREAEAAAMGSPSALRITLPEVYLDRPDTPARIRAIHEAMADYAKHVLTRRVRGFVYVERTTASGTRAGLVGAVDLEAYSYDSGSTPPVRPSERTVTERIPPRLAVRRGAPLETPHILMLADDIRKSVVEPIGAKKDQLEKLYEADLMLGGGHIAGWAVTDSADIAAIEAALAALGTQAAFDEKYPEAAGRAPLTLAVGDGNHSLATAKAHWEEIKAALREAEWEKCPARWCLAELVNLHSPALLFEPIHRAVFGVEPEAFIRDFEAYIRRFDADAPRPKAQTFTLLTGGTQRTLTAHGAPHPLAVGTFEMFWAEYSAAHPNARVDYIHGADSLRALAAKGAVGVLLPDFEKSDLFSGVALGGVLPKKTFSMGTAREKRYYLECREIGKE